MRRVGFFSGSDLRRQLENWLLRMEAGRNLPTGAYIHIFIINQECSVLKRDDDDTVVSGGGTVVG